MKKKLAVVLLVVILAISLPCSEARAAEGITWRQSDTGIWGGDIRALAIDPQTPATLYAGTNGGVFKSTDRGGTWHAANSGLTAFEVLALAVDPLAPETLYAGTNGGVFVSTNGGGSWSAANTGLTSVDVRALAIDPAANATPPGNPARQIQAEHSPAILVIPTDEERQIAEECLALLDFTATRSAEQEA